MVAGAWAQEEEGAGEDRGARVERHCEHFQGQVGCGDSRLRPLPALADADARGELLARRRDDADVPRRADTHRRRAVDTG